MDCIVDTGNGITCKETCRENVESVNRIIDRQVRMYGSNGQALKQRTLFYLAFAIFFTLMGFQLGHNRVLQISLIAMGALFLFMSIVAYTQQKKLK